jgi:hypothetical protein
MNYHLILFAKSIAGYPIISQLLTAVLIIRNLVIHIVIPTYFTYILDDSIQPEDSSSCYFKDWQGESNFYQIIILFCHIQRCE